MGKDFTFKVNGDQFHIDRQLLTASDILRLAKEKGAIPEDPTDYILEGDKGQYEGNDQIDLAEDNVFVAILNKPTPVA